MADLVIRGMEMPKYTTKAAFGIDADGNPLCMVYHEAGTEPDIYDVVPIPAEHGRLIDADELFDTMRFHRDHAELNDVRLGLDEAVGVVMNAPTIIEADLEWKKEELLLL